MRWPDKLIPVSSVAQAGLGAMASQVGRRIGVSGSRWRSPWLRVGESQEGTGWQVFWLAARATASSVWFRRQQRCGDLPLDIAIRNDGSETEV